MTRLAAVQSGISEDVRRQRLLLFGNNEIDVEGKSSVSLLLDEVPFHSPTKAGSLIRV
jgi:cation-transporting P-type ATPase 13A2